MGDYPDGRRGRILCCFASEAATTATKDQRQTLWTKQQQASKSWNCQDASLTGGDFGGGGGCGSGCGCGGGGVDEYSADDHDHDHGGGDDDDEPENSSTIYALP